eukprot:15476646-Alexandrium_andersonii.AAC.1
MCSVNVTSLKPHFPTLLERTGCDTQAPCVFAVQEHATGPDLASALTKAAIGSKATLALSPASWAGNRFVGGAGFLAS